MWRIFRMLNISHEQKRKIGLLYVLESLSPCTPFGTERIKHAVPYTKDQKAELIAELGNVERAVRGLLERQEEYDLLIRQMSLFKDIRRSLKKCLELPLSEVELFEIKRFLMNLRAVVPLFEAAARENEFSGIELKFQGEALELLDPEKKNAAGFYISSACSPELGRVRKEKRRIEDDIRRETQKEKREELFQKRLEFAAAEEREEAKAREELSIKLRAYVPELELDIQSIARLDAVIQKALLAIKYGAVKPQISDRLLFSDMIDPRLSDRLEKQGRHFTPLTAEFGPGSTVITGSNMGGKSVALRAVALNALLCQMGFFAFAGYAEFPIFESAHFLFDDREDEEYSVSSFGSEVLWLNAAIKDVGSGSFALILADEFARGTNPDEGALIIRSVVKALNARRCIAAFTTHYDGAAEYASCHYQVTGLKRADFAKLASEVRDPGEGIEAVARSMDYGLYKIEGKANCPRDALNICRLLGLDRNILDEIERSY
jgi:dsDNA-specific endonuclease/ATPase MutS2